MNIIIVGCGRVGSQLAMLFSESRDEVCVIDSNQTSFKRLGRNFEGRTIIGMGFDEEVLKEAGVEDCDVLAAVTDQDTANLMISEVGRRLFEVPHVIARLYNPSRESAYMQLGLDYVCGTTLVAEEMFSKIISGHGSHIDTIGDFEILRFSLNLRSYGEDSLRVRDIERPHQLRIIAFERNENGQSSIPDKDSVLMPGDVVVACVKKELIGELTPFMYS
ncbi:MAG: TrkA family potassium uptake protein [Coriobacteriales bacterium]|jgi:trk system potassium uptake protein TrkA|nr:TrkA family potassium uptake protein [Coriobacteriales bacterium]